MKEVADLVTPIAKEYGAREVCVYGPYARGNADGNSVVNLYFRFKGPLGFSYGGVYMDLMKAFAGRMSLASEGSNPKLVERIEAEKVSVYAE